jgi:hypothetical protein
VAALAQRLEQSARWNRNRRRPSRSGCDTMRFGSTTRAQELAAQGDGVRGAGGAGSEAVCGSTWWWLLRGELGRSSCAVARRSGQKQRDAGSTRSARPAAVVGRP